MAIVAVQVQSASLVIRWTTDGPRTEQISLLPTDVTLPQGWSRERALAEWTRPATGGEQRWDSLPEGTYQIVLRAGSAAAGAAVPQDLGEIVLTKDEERSVRVTLPAAPDAVTTRGPSSWTLRVPATPEASEQFAVSHWNGTVLKPLAVTRSQTAAEILLRAETPCASGDVILVESSSRIGVAKLDPPCGGIVDVPMRERVALTVDLALPRGMKVPSGGIVRFGRCEPAPAAVDVPFAVRQGRVKAGIPARCGEASLRVDGFAPAMLPLPLNDDTQTVALKPGAAAALRVRARRDARPLAGVRVEAVRAHELRSMRDELRTGQAALAAGVTDSAGWVRFSGLPDDEIVFLFFAAERTYPQMSEPYALRAGEETIIEDALLDDPANVFVTVSTPDEVKNALELDAVELRPAGRNRWPPQIAIRGVLSPGGAAIPDVPPGTWSVRATGRVKNGYAVRLAQTDVDVVPGIDRYVTLNVTDKLYHGRVLRDDNGVSGVLNLKYANRRSGVRSTVATLGAGGTFAVLLERGGNYSAQVQETTGSGIMLGEYVAFDDPEKEIVIELPAGRIQGRVVDGAGAAVSGALVSATQQFAEPRATSFARNRSDGTFVLENIGPGSWEIVAETSNGRSDTATVSFDESDPEGVTLLLEPIRKVTVRVVDVTGAPVRDAFVTIEFPRAGSPSPRTYIQTTGPEGGAEFRLSRAEQATPTNVVVATTDLRLSCDLRRLDGDQTVTAASAGGELHLVGREIARGTQGWLVSSRGCAVPFIGTRVETDRSDERVIVFPGLAAGTWSYVETSSGEELARVLTGRAATLSPLKTFRVEAGKTTRVILGRGAK